MWAYSRKVRDEEFNRARPWDYCYARLGIRRPD